MALLLLAVPAACSRPGADGATTSEPGSTTASGAQPVFDIDGFCDKTMAMSSERKCSGDDEIIEGNKIGYCVTELVKARDDGRVIFDHDQAARCVAAVRSAKEPLRDRRTLRDLGMRFESCRQTASGQQKAGMECKTTMECTQGLRCVSSKCVQPAALGKPCVPLKEVSLSNVTSSCAAGLHCDGAACASLAKEGASCAVSGACQPPLRCRAGQCAVASDQATGAPCEDDADCDSKGYCTTDKPPVCQARKQAGSKCVLNRECLGRCSRKDRQCVSYCGSG
ncbi:MAG: hypothetical protein DRI90_03845 [Deltaproteobacteria bacterium]|nr:MAG: hypothetical protein DRI90_03845 [Deltaproteobacteria bacterium]